MDDDAPPAVNVCPAQVAEGNTSLTDAAVKVQLSRPSAKPVSERAGRLHGCLRPQRGPAVKKARRAYAARLRRGR